MSIEVASTIQDTAEVVAKTAAPAQKAVNVVTKTFFKVAGKTKRFTPEILLVVGVAGVTTAAVLAAKATLRLESVIEKAELQAEEVKDRHKNDEFESETAYTKALSRVYVNRGIDVVKLYTPALSVGLVGIGCLIGSHGVMNQRNVASIAAYKSLESGFMEYRKRVAEEVGEEKEALINSGYKETEVTTTDADGKEQVKVALEPFNGLGSGYGRLFDQFHDDWSKVPGQNQTHLFHQQRYLNDKLNAQGYLFLNEVYRALGFPETTAGQVVGWLANTHSNFDPLNNDGFVDFGLQKVLDQQKSDFVNAFEKSVWLDFNVDGIMHNLI
jgi:Family of unknown function (DUF6353)